MKRLLILVGVVALAMYVTNRPILAASGHGGHSGGGHYSGGHSGGGHYGGGHSVGRHYGRHIGLGHHYSGYYGYRYPYSYGYGYSYPAYSSYYSPTYRRAYRSGYRSCSSPSVTAVQPSQPKAAEDEPPQVEPALAPEALPPPPPALEDVPRAETSPRSPGTIRYAVLRSEQPPADFAPNRIAGPTPGASAASTRPSAVGTLGPQLAVPKVRSLISDDDVPWVAE